MIITASIPIWNSADIDLGELPTRFDIARFMPSYDCDDGWETSAKADLIDVAIGMLVIPRWQLVLAIGEADVERIERSAADNIAEAHKAELDAADAAQRHAFAAE